MSKIVPPEKLEDFIKTLRTTKKKIVTLNGSFDLLHAGHLYILREAKNQGDFLILALNSDESVRKNKGDKRPIIPLPYRIQMVASLEMVDYVTWFEEEDPRALLKTIRPDVHVNGAEYGPNCIEAETVKKYGGKLHLALRLPSLSTSEIIAKIKDL